MMLLNVSEAGLHSGFIDHTDRLLYVQDTFLAERDGMHIDNTVLCAIELTTVSSQSHAGGMGAMGEPWVREHRKVLCFVLAAIGARVAQRLLARRNRLPGPWVCEESINACDVIGKAKFLPVGSTATKAKVTWLQSHPLALITLVNVRHTPPTVTCLMTLATSRHCLLALKVLLWRLLRNR